jgi:hypothetical protein
MPTHGSGSPIGIGSPNAAVVLGAGRGVFPSPALFSRNKDIPALRRYTGQPIRKPLSAHTEPGGRATKVQRPGNIDRPSMSALG